MTILRIGNGFVCAIAVEHTRLPIRDWKVGGQSRVAQAMWGDAAYLNQIPAEHEEPCDDQEKSKTSNRP